MMETVLEARDLDFDYHPAGVPVLRGVDLKAERGSVTAVLGPNGSGKTTLLHILLGWLRPLRGTVFVDGRNISAYTSGERGRIVSFVPQSEHIPFEYSLLEYVLLGRIPHLRPLEQPKERDVSAALGALETVGLDGKDRRSVSMLSGGEKQLLLIARCLCQDPRIVLLDEPTSHLDPGNRRKIIGTLQRLNRSGLTVIFSTHDPHLALTLAENALLLKEGRMYAGDGWKMCLRRPTSAMSTGHRWSRPR